MHSSTGRVRFQRAARAPLLAGCATFAHLLGATLGPTGRIVAVNRMLKAGPPEMLASAALIARRTFRLPDPFQNAGAMLLRHAVWRVYDRTGDGTATTAVLASRLLHELDRLLTAGYSPLLLSQGLDRAAHTIIDTLRSLARPVDNLRVLAGLLTPLCLSPQTADELLDTLEALGPDGIVLVDPDHRPDVQVQLIQGIHWQTRLLAPELLLPHTATLQMVEPRILLTDWKLEQASQLLPLLEECARRSVRRLLIVASELSGQALALLRTNIERGVLHQVAAVAAPSVGLQQTRILEDLAALTGGHAFLQAAGDRPEQARYADLGSARQALVTRWTFALAGARGNRAAIERRITLAKAELAAAEDESARRRARERLGRLRGVFLHLRVGGTTTTEQEYRCLALESLARTLQTALATGLVPGGGASFAAAARQLAAQEFSLPSDERAALRAVRLALLEPLRTLARNAGVDSAVIVNRSLEVAPNLVYDVLADQWVDPWSAALLDPLGVLEAAVETSLSLGRTFLTTDVLVHRTWPAASAEP